MGLFSKKQLEDIVVIDIETTSGEESLNALNDKNPRLADLWVKRCEYLRVKHSDNAELSDEEIYDQKSGLQAEFGKIVCITVGYVRFNETGLPIIKTKSYQGHNEEELLLEFFKFMNQLATQLPNSKLTGHAIKRFDVPFICKRALILGLELPQMLIIHDKKPWQLSFIDTAELWGHGAWQESFTSLDTLTAVLDVPSPKSDIDGSQVTEVYWRENDLERIVMYCERDVTATAQAMLRLSGIDIATQENILSV